MSGPAGDHSDPPLSQRDGLQQGEHPSTHKHAHSYLQALHHLCAKLLKERHINGVFHGSGENLTRTKYYWVVAGSVRHKTLWL